MSKPSTPTSTKQPWTTSVGNGGETHQRGGGLTTNHGVPISDNQNSLKAGARGPTLLEDFVLREKIFHFDHERIPERIVHARGSGAHGVFEALEDISDLSKAAVFKKGEQDRDLRPLLDRRRRRGVGRHAARRARLRGQILHARGQLGPRRQQHPGVLHPGRDQVSRPGPRGEDGGRQGLSAGRHRARHLLGLRQPDARIDPHADVGDERPHHPALVAHDRGVRRPHLPAGQRGGRIDLRQVPLEARARAAVDLLGRGGQDRRRRPRFPPPRPVRSDRARRLPGSGTSASRCSTRSLPRRSPTTCSMRPS